MNMATHGKKQTDGFRLSMPVLLSAYTTNVVDQFVFLFCMEMLRKEIQALEPFDEKTQVQIQGDSFCYIQYSLLVHCLLQYLYF
jgi:hypothetical protein